jgi:hypothetical protein
MIQINDITYESKDYFNDLSIGDCFKLNKEILIKTSKNKAFCLTDSTEKGLAHNPNVKLVKACLNVENIDYESDVVYK